MNNIWSENVQGIVTLYLSRKLRFDKSGVYFVIKERNIFHSDFNEHKGIELAIQDLAAFHNANEIVEKQ